MNRVEIREIPSPLSPSPTFSSLLLMQKRLAAPLFERLPTRIATRTPFLRGRRNGGAFRKPRVSKRTPRNKLQVVERWANRGEQNGFMQISSLLSLPLEVGGVGGETSD